MGIEISMKGKERFIGAIIGGLIAIAGAAAGLNSREVKEGVCGAPAVIVAPTASPISIDVK